VFEKDVTTDLKFQKVYLSAISRLAQQWEGSGFGRIR